MRPATAALVLLLALALCGCGEEGTGGGAVTGDPGPAPRPTRSAGAPAPGPSLEPARCPPGLAGCATTEGRIVYVERVDPDGDGDAHFVVLDPPGITAPGLTAIDVRRGLRPRPLPGIGTRISAAGPVQTGSYGQSQIHAVELNVPRG